MALSLERKKKQSKGALAISNQAYHEHKIRSRRKCGANMSSSVEEKWMAMKNREEVEAAVQYYNVGASRANAAVGQQPRQGRQAQPQANGQQQQQQQQQGSNTGGTVAAQ
jgi:hypothetical protein